MKPFLYSIAEAYLDNESDRLVDCCFIFPNKRSAIYFTDYMAKICRERGNGCVHPATTTIVEFVDDFRESVLGERMELIFILYGVYRDVVRRHHGEKEAASIDFNRFVHWADVLLNDFDDVDNSMVNARELFKNVGNLKEISANYLTPEQIEVIRHFWNEERVPQEVQEFWNHVAYPSDGNSGREAPASVGFLRLWQVMYEIYHDFQGKIDEMGLHTSGMAYRDAAIALKSMEAGDLDFNRYVFVGFNNLSQAEHCIFARLRDLRDASGDRIGDFYWDISSPAFADPHLAGARKVMDYAREFPSRFDCVAHVGRFPRIEVIGVPSRVGQSKAVSGILGSLFPSDRQPDAGVLRDTAIVLPEEDMLIPLLNSLPPHITPLNITMGYKLRNTAVAGLIRDIVSMQMRAYRSKSSNTFFYEDVVNVLSHPLVRTFKPTLCTMLLLHIQQKRLFNVPERMFMEPPCTGMEAVFRFVGNKAEPVDVFDYLLGLLKWLSEAVDASAGGGDDSGDASVGNPSGAEAHAGGAAVRNHGGYGRSAAMQEAFLKRYSNAVLHLRNLCGRYIDTRHGAFMENATVFNLVERLVQGEMLNFEGMPLRGLQIMGVLEARSLDFDTLLIPSMNERIFPRARFTASFIPAVLRNAYRLPTPEDQENVYAYFFYRMIARARRVFLLYDARSTGLKSRQASRYIHQLTHIFRPEDFHKVILPYKLTSIGRPDITVAKTPEIIRILDRYRSGNNPLYLSASSIKQYIGCPMSFYFEKIAHYRREDDINDWIDESTYGTIVHDVFEKLYGELLAGHPGGVTVTASMLGDMSRDIVKIDRLICRAVNEFYRRLGTDSYEPLTGDVKLVGRLIREYVAEVLRKEMAQTPFVYLHGEWEGKQPLEIVGSGGKQMTINFNCRIDRVDRYIGDGTFPRIRVIDYKTGSDSTAVSNMEQMFHDFQKKAFMQVMLYSQAYARFRECSEPIQPMVYSMRSLMISPVSPLKGPAPVHVENVDNAELKRPARGTYWNILDYRDYTTEFNDMLLPYLEELFNPDVPFRCAEDNDACKYCAFTAVCQRENKF